MRLVAVAGLAAALALGGAFAGRTQEIPATPSPQPAPPAPAAPQAPAAGPPASAPSAPPNEAPPDEEAAPPPAAAAPPAKPEPPPKPAEPLKRAKGDAAILQATDKITAETLRFQARVGAPVRYKDLVVTVQACETSAADEPVKDSIAHLEVVSRPTSVQGREATTRLVFRGWMFANSPGLHPFEHPVYDLWLIACRTVAPSAPAGKR